MTRRDRLDVGNTLAMAAVTAFLGYMAFGSYWHAGLSGFLVFAISAAGNRIGWEIHQALGEMYRAPGDAPANLDGPLG